MNRSHETPLRNVFGLYESVRPLRIDPIMWVVREIIEDDILISGGGREGEGGGMD